MIAPGVVDSGIPRVESVFEWDPTGHARMPVDSRDTEIWSAASAAPRVHTRRVMINTQAIFAFGSRGGGVAVQREREAERSREARAGGERPLSAWNSSSSG